VALTGLPLPDELGVSDARGEAYGRTLDYLTEEYLCLPGPATRRERGVTGARPEVVRGCLQPRVSDCGSCGAGRSPTERQTQLPNRPVAASIEPNTGHFRRS
jgi:hypothetical protein